ncbi:glycosyltransferase [Actinophytocola algeriensis]|uniref:glycosyltransferase n=1 Tax=Actinophytocola algeriensis TaxID=1768010 RepID=UPI001616855D|nr:glycosyltransferase [Actinophytocola algeriensis]
MRVLVVHNRYRTEQPSGEDNVVDQEVALLRAAGHDVDRFERRSDDIAGMSLPRKALVPLGVPWNPRARSALAERLRTERPDVVHVHNTFPLLSASVLDACRDAGVPVVATLHNYTQVCPSGTLYRDGATCTACVGKLPLPALRHGCYRGSTVATVPLAVNLLVNQRRWWSGVSRFLCISDAQRRTLVANGMPAELLTVKYNFVEDTDVRRAGTGEHLLYLGRLTEEKGVRLLMAAWERVSRAGGLGVPLVIAGAGPLADEVAAWARARADVTFAGLQDKASSRALIARSIAVVVPSRWLETFGLVVVEAMAAGVPSVVAGHSSLAELVDDGVTGLTHTPGDAASLASALGQIVRAPSSLGRAARARYEHGFTPSVGLANLVAQYERVVRESRRGTSTVR